MREIFRWVFPDRVESGEGHLKGAIHREPGEGEGALEVLIT